MRRRVWKRWAGRVGGLVLAGNLAGLLGCVSAPQAPATPPPPTAARGASQPPAPAESGGESLVLRPEGLAQDKAPAPTGFPAEVTERLNKAREAFRRQDYAAAENLFSVVA